MSGTNLESPTIDRSIEAAEVGMIEMLGQHNGDEQRFVHHCPRTTVWLPSNDMLIFWQRDYLVEFRGEQPLDRSLIVLDHVL
jgi:hypothetical protein